MVRLSFPAALIACLLALVAPSRAQVAGQLKLDVTEIARSVDLSRGREPFLTVVIEITGAEPARLRRVQPLREHFRILAGKSVLHCRWLKGGTVPEDPARVRFTLGFSRPPAGVRTLDLVAELPRLDAEDALEVRLEALKPGEGEQERRGAGWAVRVEEFGVRGYVPPALPPSGYFYSKAGPMDARIFREGEAALAGKGAPAEAVHLSLVARDVALYDPTVGVSGSLIVQGGPSTPLLSGMLRRDPSRTVKAPRYGPHTHGNFYFAVPVKGRPTGAVLRFQRQPADVGKQTVRKSGLPVP